jgi:methylated-DNA-[protein]-cysteine S-methyltransferase
VPHLTLHSPLGEITVFEAEGAIVALEWGRGAGGGEATALLAEARRQLDAYFDDPAHRFDLPLAPAGTAFQRRVWAEMQAIPPGRTRRYGELAACLGSSARAVGAACGANPIPIIVPCHRVIGAGGALGGYSGGEGQATKRFLLELEGAADGTPGLFHDAGQREHAARR